MARGNLFLGTAYGSVGDTTFFMRDGKQVSRARRRNVKNPRTERQSINRALLSTLGVAYSYMQGIVDHSFQGRNGKTANMQEFMKQNQGYVRGHVMSFNPTLTVDSPYNFNFKGESALRPNPYIIARGTLPTVQIVAPAEGQLINGFKFAPGIESVLFGSDAAQLTYQQVADLFGVELGSQVTFCIIADDNFVNIPAAGNMPQGLGNFHYSRIILAPDDMDGSKLFWSILGETYTVANPNSHNQGKVEFITGGKIIVNGKQFPLAMGAILSNFNGRWLRSNCEMVVAGDYEYDNILSDVVDSYMNAAEMQPSSDLYLNQSEAPKRTTGNHTLDRVEDNDGGTITPVDGVYNVNNNIDFLIFVKGEVIAPVYTGNAVNFSSAEFDRSSGEWRYVFSAIAVGKAEIKIGSVVVNVNVTE
jgi:hypothetical protein